MSDASGMEFPLQRGAASRATAGNDTPFARLTTWARLTIAAAMIGVAVSYSVVYLFHLVLTVLLVLTVRFAMQGLPARRLPDRSHWILYALFLWYAASILWSIEPLYSVRYLFYLFCGISVVVVTMFCVRDEETLARVVRLAGGIIAVEVVIGILETFTPFRLPVSPYSSLAPLFGREPVIDASMEQQAIQYLLSSPTGFQWNPNDLAGTLTIFFPFCFLHRSRFVRYIGSLLMLTVIFFTGSRASYIAVFVSLFVWAFAFSARRAGKVVLVVLVAVIAMPFALQAMRNSQNIRLVQAAEIGELLSEYLEGNLTQEDDSVAIRRELIANGLEALRDSSGLGVGGGASIAVQEHAGGSAAKVTTSMHNFWIEVLVDGGVLIAAMFVCWYLWLALRCYQIAMFTRRPYVKYVATALVCSISSFSFAMISSSSVIYVLPMWFMYGLACSVLNLDRILGRGASPGRPHMNLIAAEAQ